MPIVFKTDNAASYLNTLYTDGTTTLPSGRKLYRHTTLPGSVLCFNDGIDRKVLVLDAKYRIGPADGNLKYGWLTTNNSNLANVTRDPFNFADLEGYPDISDNVLNTYIIDPKTSRENTTALVTDYPEDSIPEAALHCRSVIIGDNLTCDLPNINTLMRIKLEYKYIDELDPTINDGDSSIMGNKYRSLESIFENYCHSSTTNKMDDSMDILTRYTWSIDNEKIHTTTSILTALVVPVYEL